MSLSTAFAMSYTVNAAIEAATSASISTPVCAVVSAEAVICTRSGADLEPDVDDRERERMAERDQLGRPLRGHDPGDLRGRERVALRQLAQLPGGLRGHGHGRRCGGAAARQRLGADVDHADVARFVNMGEIRHS